MNEIMSFFHTIIACLARPIKVTDFWDDGYEVTTFLSISFFPEDGVLLHEKHSLKKCAYTNNG